eukprot:7380942-Prymnesium_polylepis.2
MAIESMVSCAARQDWHGTSSCPMQADSDQTEGPQSQDWADGRCARDYGEDVWLYGTGGPPVV